MKHSKIVIYLDLPGIYDPPLSTQRRIDAYSDLAFTVEALGGQVFIARSPDSYSGNGMFTDTYVFTKARELVEAGDVGADVIFDKGDSSTLPIDGFTKVNHVEIDRLCNSKIRTAETYADMSPMTIEVSKYSELRTALRKIPGVRKVFKPSDGFGGEGIVIADDHAIINTVPKDEGYPALVQEFIDTSGGVPGIAEGLHDLRVLVLNGEPVQFSLRVPKEGSLLANVQQGGSIDAIPLTEIPEQMNEFISRVDEGVAQYGNRFYAIDTAYDGSEYRLIELNSRPGWHPISFGEEAKACVEKLAAMLVGIDETD